jgi:nucleoside-diphosphate-sugar epimerase
MGSVVLVTAGSAPLLRHLLAEPGVSRIVAVGPVDLTDPRLTVVDADLGHARQAHDVLFGPGREATALVHDGRAREEVTRELVNLAESHPTLRRFVLCSSSLVYRVDHRQPDLLDEDAALDFGPRAPEEVRRRVAAEATVALHLGSARLRAVILRLAEIMAPGSGGQLWDYLRSRVCLRPLGFDPMMNLLSSTDAGRAVALALAAPVPGVFNIAGADTLPLSRVIALWGRLDVPLPGALLEPLYRLRSRTVGGSFHYGLSAGRLHHGALLDDRRARTVLGYQARHPLHWPAR